MEAYFYDIESSTGVFMVTFLNVTTPEELIKAYIEADIAGNLELKKKIVELSDSYLFILTYNNCTHLPYLLEFLSQKLILIGFNNEKYDDPMLDHIILTGKNVSEDGCYVDTGMLFVYTQWLADLTDTIISCKSNYKWIMREQYPHYKRNYYSYDIRKILHLDQTFTSLKQISITLDWYRVEDFDFREMRKIANPNRETIAMIADYNFNDVLITRLLWWKEHEEVNLRETITKVFNVNVRNDSRSATGMKLIKKLYCDELRISDRDFPRIGTVRGKIAMRDVIFPEVKYKTPQLQKFYNDLYKKVIRVGYDKFSEKVIFGGNVYQLGYGGIHTKDKGREFFTDDEFVIEDIDADSYYPKLIINWKLCPAHLSLEVFIRIFTKAVDMRLKAKAQLKTDLSIEDCLIYTAQAEGLKISINAVGGKLAERDGLLCDLLAFYRMTVNGQLFLLMLAESLELEGIHAISANTDGLTCKIPRDKLDKYHEVCTEWAKSLNLTTEYAVYERYYRRDVNNYIAVKEGFNEAFNDLKLCDESLVWLKSQGHKVFAKCSSIDECYKAIEGKYIKFKGCFTQQHDITKGYNPLVVPIALKNYFMYDIDVSETIKNDREIYHFCKSQKIAAKFELRTAEYDPLEEALLEAGIQKDTRFYVSTNGGLLIKYDTSKKPIDVGYGKSNPKGKAVLSSLNVIVFNKFNYASIETRNINYNYYIKECKKIINEVRFNKNYNEIPMDW